MSYKILIVDDEEPARDLLKTYAEKLSEIEVAGIFDNGLDAKRAITEGEIDILLTDIQMEDFTGIDLLKTLKNPPVSIFTTAYSEYAIEGYDLDIIDYLVKPISFQRFCKAIDKAIELIQFKKGYSENKNTNNNTSSIPPKKQEYIFVKTNRKIVKVAFNDIQFVESFGEYIKIYTQDDVLLALQRLSYLEEVLPSDDFKRIHRSHIVNIQHIKEIVGNEVVLNEHRLLISKRMKEQFLKFIKSKGII